ncbi:PspA/IM30 family protein [Halosquirtibacter xylanolyticus]|uniref:PspA/IM30 family protein n=1 Tax=Halosquirtibacter xylanolyticus TaxID=3374599 RepID=UPI00374820A2|nr:PspA/IM30 family protein [Prolixibacteraceae bacterium]
MGIFQRLFKVGEANANSAIDKLENPVKMTEQGIRDLKKDLSSCMESLAEIKALRIRSYSEKEQFSHKAQNYESKAIQLLQKAERGEIEATEADRLAGEALKRKGEATQEVSRLATEVTNFDQQLDKLGVQVKNLQTTISKYENELRTLKARARVSKATEKINKSISRVGSDNTISMLEKMKDKVAQQEALAQAYGEMNEQPKSVDHEIDAVLSQGTSTETSSELEALKMKLKK